jgi:hypothetical protein
MLDSVKHTANILVCKYTLPTIVFMQSKYELSILNKNLTSKLRCVLNLKHTLSFEELVWKKEYKGSP